MTLPSVIASGISASPELTYVKGGFLLESTAVPFFATSMKVQWLNEHLLLPAELPIDPSRPLTLEELFQRELDVTRVETQIFPYLQSRESLRFFNALTVVLLPLDPDTRFLGQVYPDTDLAPHSSAANAVGNERLDIGAIQLVHNPADPDVGLINWNTDLTAPIVLDGQHRFAALRHAVKSQDAALAQALRSSRVPVLFLILDERVGFAGPSHQQEILPACRALFVFLNKHARTVSKVRTYLLDDMDPLATSMRAVLATSAAIGSPDATIEVVRARTYESNRLPLALVDIRSDSAKVNTGPYVTSALTLYEMTSKLLGVTALPLSTEYDAQASYIEKLMSVLRLSSLSGRSVYEWRKLIEDRETAEIPFQISREVVSKIGESFGHLLGPRVVRPLVALKPYARLIQDYEHAGLCTSDLEPWFSYSEAERDTLVKALRASNPDRVTPDPKPIVEEISARVKKDYRLAYQVVFQRGFLLALHLILSLGGGACARAMYEEWTDEEPEVTAQGHLSLDAEKRLIDEWIARWNVALGGAPMGIWSTDAGNDSPFLGTGLRAEGEVDFRRPAVERIAALVGLVTLSPIEKWRQLPRPDSAIQYWVEEVWNSIAPGPPSGRQGLFSYFGSRWRSSLRTLESTLNPTSEEEVLDMQTTTRAVAQLKALLR